jgi:single-stranded-DNA-specific exonuclease
LPELRIHLDRYARERLSLADFEPVLAFDAELSLDQITPELFQALKRLEPFGMGNPEPVFSAQGLRLMAPVRVMKDKHVKLRVAAGLEKSEPDRELTEAGVLPVTSSTGDSMSSPRGNGNWKKSVSYNALGWRMAERFQQAKLLPGDEFDIAFTLVHNDHPDFGGLELSLKDFRTRTKFAEEKPAASFAKAT